MSDDYFEDDGDNIIQFVSKKDKADALDPIDGSIYIIHVHMNDGKKIDVTCSYMGFNPFTGLYTFYTLVGGFNVRATHMVSVESMNYLEICEAEYVAGGELDD